VREHGALERVGLGLVIVALLLGASAVSADAKEPSARGTSAKSGRATNAATARSKARPTSSAKAARQNAKRRAAVSTPPAEAAPKAPEQAASAPAAAAVSASEPARDGNADAGAVKTFTFKAQEIEGRLKAPQILYFLRRVRAEFDAQALGHRSFLLELSDTRRQQALR
jgi:hypothetical protein